MVKEDDKDVAMRGRRFDDIRFEKWLTAIILGCNLYFIVVWIYYFLMITFRQLHPSLRNFLLRVLKRDIGEFEINSYEEDLRVH